MNTLKYSRFIVAMAVGCAVGIASAATNASDTVLLTAARMYVSPDAGAIDDGALLMRDGKIVAVGKRRELSISAGVKPAECNGGFVTAGFQNSHVHFIGDQWSDARRKPASELSRAMTEMVTRFGYTSVVDLASDRDNTIALRARVESGEIPGPRIFIAAPLFPVKGIPSYLESFPQDFVAKLPQPETAEAAARIVHESIDAHVDATKLFVATPQKDNKLARMPGDITRAAAEETHRRGKLLVVHPTDLDGLRTALDAKVDILAHPTLGATEPWPEPILRQIIATKVALTPTLKLMGYELKKENVPQDIAARLISAAVDQVKTFSAAGGQVLFGTDVGYMSEFDPTEEYVLLARAGLTPMQILNALTTAPAARWKVSDRRGRLKVGMDADITVLKVDPATDPAGFAQVRCAFRGGQLIYSGK
jgi:imidazolonepropionase-like amidohydrolase